MFKLACARLYTLVFSISSWLVEYHFIAEESLCYSCLVDFSTMLQQFIYSTGLFFWLGALSKLKTIAGLRLSNPKVLIIEAIDASAARPHKCRSNQLSFMSAIFQRAFRLSSCQ